MVKKLKYLLTVLTKSNLLYKSLLLSVFLVVLFRGWQFEASPFWLLPILLLGVIFYFSEDSGRELLRTSYWLNFFLPLSILWLLSRSILPPNAELIIGLLAIVATAIVFYLIVGVIKFTFNDRYLIYNLINTSILAFVFLIFFSLVNPIPGVYSLLLFLVIFLVFKEYFNFYNIKGKRPLVVSSVFGLLATQVSWFSALLPLGVVNSAVFLVLITVLLRDTMTSHFQGTMDKSFLIRQFGFLVFLTIIIFASTTWVI
ncbi:MAG: hypothetical protein WD095_01250 [Candidatus Paceibacterota bacterium]